VSAAQRSLLALLGLTLLASCIAPPFPQQMVLQHLPTVALLAALPFAARRIPLSDTAFACLVAFLLLHVVGARYIYSYVPYDRWTEALFGVNLTGAFGFRRNHWDRVVHFCFGAFWVRPVWEVCVRRFGVPRRFAWYTAFEFVLAFSMVYELFEWGLAMVLSPRNADAYNGQQGDFWDAQKDMSLALLGACLALVAVAVRGALTPRGGTEPHRPLPGTRSFAPGDTEQRPARRLARGTASAYTPRITSGRDAGLPPDGGGAA
jgi:putative membrane protein